MQVIVTEGGVLVGTASVLDIPEHVVRMVRTIGASGNHAVPLIQFLRVEYKFGLKQAKDLHDGIRDLPVTY